MEVFLHIGTNKTGSSAIQSELIRSKAQLIKNGFYLPNSKGDKKMLEGYISAGNGHELAIKLAEGNKNELSNYLLNQFSKAEFLGLHKIIFSNEVLVRLFSNIHLLNLLEQVFLELGVRKVFVLCFWRNAQQHSLSLFKHRAKDGKYDSYKEWFENDYETLKLALPFIKNSKNIGWDWSHRVYQKNIISVFFKEFLQISTVQLIEKKTVNNSLSLNDLSIIRFFEKIYIGSAERLYPLLINIPFDRVENDSLVVQFNKEYCIYSSNYRESLNIIAKQLSPNEALAFLKESELEANMNNADSFVINTQYSEILNHFFSKYSNVRMRERVLLHLRGGYRKIVRILTRNVFDKNRYGGSL